MASRIDWDRLRFPKKPKVGSRKPEAVSPKPKPRAPIKTTKHRAKRNRTARVAAADDRGRVFDRQGHTCFAAAVSPVCRRRVQDPHELIPVGRGGKRVSGNRVGLCRPCHDAAQGHVGGNPLVFDWVGKADGQPPNADVPGNVTCRWVGQPVAAGKRKG